MTLRPTTQVCWIYNSIPLTRHKFMLVLPSCLAGGKYILLLQRFLPPQDWVSSEERSLYSIRALKGTCLVIEQHVPKDYLWDTYMTFTASIANCYFRPKIDPYKSYETGHVSVCRSGPCRYPSSSGHLVQYLTFILTILITVQLFWFCSKRINPIQLAIRVQLFFILMLDTILTGIFG